MKNKFYKLLSIIVAVVLVFTCCSVALTVSVGAATATYYVSASGSDDEGTTGEAGSPFLTVKTAVAKAIADNYGAGDTVTIKVGKPDGAAETVNGSGMAVYEFDMIVESANPAAKSTLTYGRGGRLSNNVVGTTTYKNVKISNKGEQNTSVQLYRSDVVFESDVEFEIHNTSQIVCSTNDNKTGSRQTAGQNIVIKNSNLTYIQLSTFNSSNEVYTDAVNLTFNTTKPATIFFNGSYLGAANGSTTYKKLVNVYLQSGAGTTLNFHSATFNEGVNVINSTGSAVTVGTAAKSADKTWIINNKTGNADIIAPTTTPGEFTINNTDTSRQLELLDANGNEVEINDGKVNLTAGIYELNFVKLPKTVEVYIASEADGGSEQNPGISEDAPLLTVNAAIKKAIEHEATDIDTVVIKVVGTEGVAEWGTDDIAYTFKKLIIESNDPKNRSTLKFHGKDKTTTAHTGNLEFQNIIINQVDSRFRSNGRSVTFGENVTLNTGIHLAPGSTTVPQAQTITINNAWVGSSNRPFHVGNYNHSTVTFNSDVNIIVDNSAAKPIFTFIGTFGGGRTNTVAGNLNFAIYDAASVVFNPTSGTSNGSKGGISVSGAVQLIVNSKVTPSTTGITNLTNINPTGGFYHIIDATGVDKGVEFVPGNAAGTYKLNIDRTKYDVYCTSEEDGESTLIEGDILKVAKPGKYTISLKKLVTDVNFYPDPDSADDAYNPQVFTTIAEAIQMAKDLEFTTGDTVTIKLGDTADIPFGSIPTYKFNLVIESDVKTELTTTGNIANNEGAHTHFKNVKISRSDGGAVYLKNSSATFDSDVVFDLRVTDAALVLGTGNEDTVVTVNSSQRVEINCAAPASIYLSNWTQSHRTYNDDITLVINNLNTASSVYFNAVYDSSASGTTTYNGNVNINIKQAQSISFKMLDGVTFGASSYVQLINNNDTTMSGVPTLKGKVSKGVYHIKDNTYNKGVLDFTDTLGKYNVNTGLTIIANRTTPAFTKTAQDGILDLKVSDADSGLGEWVLTSTAYFEDFNNTTIAELKKDWEFSTYDSKTAQLVGGKLKIISRGDLEELPSLNKHKKIASKEQFISMDMKGDKFPSETKYAAPFVIMARLGGRNYIESYAIRVYNGRVEIVKYSGNKQNGEHLGNTSGFLTTDGLWGDSPGEQHKFSYNAEHTYRVAISVVTGDFNGNEVAYVRGILLNRTTNEVMFDATYMDMQPYTGEGFAFISPSGEAENVCVDNIYFSTEGFREGDEGMVQGDLNGDGVYDIRDLVFTDEAIASSTEIDVAARYVDFDGDGAVDSGDLPQIRKNILNDYEAGNEFDIIGQSDAEANEMRENILSSTSSIVEHGDGTYTYTSTAIVKDADAEGGYRTETKKHTKTGNVWYVSNGTVNGDGSKDNPWTLKQLQDNIISDKDHADAGEIFADKKVRPGDAVLFERGKEYRTTNLMWDYATNGKWTTTSGAYLNMCENTLYGAWGEGDKPRFIDSAKNYADAEWEDLGDNIYRIEAPEIATSSIDNNPAGIVFDGGKKVGQRRPYPDSATAGGKIYTLFKEGQFTYYSDEDHSYLYLYCTDDPSEKYSSIEVSRAIFGIRVNSHENKFIIDNLAFHGFGNGTIYGAFGNNDVTVTNCEFGYSGGSFSEGKDDEGNVIRTRFGNAVGLWDGGTNFKINYNWIYQTWDTAISPQGANGTDYTGFEVKGNLLEYNNCDIELFDSGREVNYTKKSIWNDVIFSDNIMRFTTKGRGSREANTLRGIQGVIRGSFNKVGSVDLDWTDNIIDSPGREILNLDNSIDDNNIFKFGEVYNAEDKTSELGNNTYYLNPYVRNNTLILQNYVTEESKSTYRYAGTKEEFYKHMELFDKSSKGTKYYWLGKEVTSGN